MLSMVLSVVAAVDVRVTEQADPPKDWTNYATLAATVFAAVGTVAAVVVALWQTRRSVRKNATIRSRGFGTGFEVVVGNEGPRSFTVESILFRRKDGRVLRPDPVTVPLPKALADGEAVVLRYEGLDQFNDVEKIIVWDTVGVTWQRPFEPYPRDRMASRAWRAIKGVVRTG